MLIDEIEVSQRLVRTDAYQMSIGEVVTMYKDGDLIIDPEFQRLFRWEIGQKSKLVESLLLGIPIPSIFVFEKDDSKWELIDGLQRISTILEFMGLLKDPEGNLQVPSYLEPTKYLPSLKNVVWEKNDRIAELPLDQQRELDRAFHLAIRRSRLSVEILKRPSDNHTKFDLFQRLNASGTPANPQELRNCIVIMINANYYRFLKRLASSNDFLAVVGVNEEQKEKQKHLEYLCRFFSHTFIPYNGDLDVEEFVDESMQVLAKQNETLNAEAVFNWTFGILRNLGGTDALRRLQNDVPVGRIGLAAFETIAVGIARNYATLHVLPNPEKTLEDAISRFWKSPEIEKFFAAGLRGTVRIQRTIPFGTNWFNI